MNIEAFFIFISLAIDFVILYLFFSSKNKLKELKVIVYYIIYSLASVLFISSFINHFFQKEYYSFRIATIFECAFFCFFYLTTLKNKVAEKFLIGSFFLFLVIAIIDFNRSSGSTFDSIPSAIESLVLISFSIYYLYEQINKPDNLFLYNTPSFWIVVGIIIFFSGNFFTFIYAQNHSSETDFAHTFRLIMSVCIFLENFLFLIAFIIARNQSKTLKPKILAKRPGIQF